MPKGNENGVQRKRKSSQKCPIKVPPMPQNFESSHTPRLAVLHQKMKMHNFTKQLLNWRQREQVLIFKGGQMC